MQSTPPPGYIIVLHRLELKPTHKPVQHYYLARRLLDNLGGTHQTAIRSAFPGQLGHCVPQFDPTLVVE